MSHALALLLSTAWLGHAATVYQSSAGFKSSAIEIGPAGVTDAAPVIMMRKKRADMDQHADTATDFASVDASAAVTHEQSPPLGNFSRVESSNPSSPSNDFAAPVDDAFVNSFVALLHDACSYSITLAVVQRTFHILPADPRRPQAHHAQAPSRRHKSITQLHHQKSVGGPFIDDDGGFFGESPIDSDDIAVPNPFSFEPGATFKQVFLELSAKLCLMFVNLVFACVYRLAVVDETPVLDDSHASDFHMGDFEKGFCQCWDDRLCEALQGGRACTPASASLRDRPTRWLLQASLRSGLRTSFWSSLIAPCSPHAFWPGSETSSAGGWAMIQSPVKTVGKRSALCAILAWLANMPYLLIH